MKDYRGSFFTGKIIIHNKFLERFIILSKITKQIFWNNFSQWDNDLLIHIY